MNAEIVFREVPEHITLAINISGCPIRCPDCHSKWLWEDTGTLLDSDELERLTVRNRGITCIAFMGGDAEPTVIKQLAESSKSKHPDIKICWYSGREVSEYDSLLEGGFLDGIDYIKLGPYRKEFGGLDNPRTNQRFFALGTCAGNKSTDLSDFFRK